MDTIDAIQQAITELNLALGAAGTEYLTPHLQAALLLLNGITA